MRILYLPAALLIIREASAVTGADVANIVYYVVCEYYRAIGYIIGTLAALMFVYAGLRWTHTDDPEVRLLARHIMEYAVIGVIFFGIIMQLVVLIFGRDICAT